MKKIQKLRFTVQGICLILTVTSFFINFKIAMIAIAALTVFSGAFYCGWICPYGFMQDLFSKFGSLLGIKKRKMPSSLQIILVFSRYVLLAIVLLIGSDFVFSLMTFDPRANFSNMLVGNIAGFAAISVMAFFLIVSLLFERPFCNYLCSEGARYGLMGSLRIFTIKRDQSLCVNCQKCDKACPMNIRVSKATNLRSPQCINCFQCISACPVKGALSFGKMNTDKNEKRKYMAIALSALVLFGSFAAYKFFGGKEDVSEEVTAPSSSESSSAQGSGDTFSDAQGIADGTYTGEGYGFKGSTVAQVTVKDQMITSIEVTQTRDDKPWFDRANSEIPERIIQSQSTDIDVVSGATYSSIGIKDAVKNALENARQ
ncbi:putative electron transport protein YccM [Peptoclostridium acidaminophilum DSM 3953]|uniref:Putative electron transport protein YccM n=1 Tax=Peptoclostridium acidaminophilum DSM 3953 TaxID=1286171 RepID=W8U9A6_PEPAC|nr:4Fe-4S binding protein [Peptoclostridium acidaminophilum]AHM57451.1 putative electron transport protein YccM [Peptoclostridium acidaminophilum DSM 3953]